MIFSLLTSLVLSQALPTVSIKYRAPALIPESFAFSPSQSLFYVGSASMGTISTVSYDGTIKTVIPPVTGGNTIAGPFTAPTTGIGSLGVKIDKDGNIYYCLSEVSKLSFTTGIAEGAVSYVAKFDKNFNRIYLSQLPVQKANFCNDLAIQGDNVWITDTASNYLFKMKASDGTMTGIPIPGSMFLDGVDYKDDYVLASDIAGGKIFKIKNDVVTEVKGVKGGYDSIIFSEDRKTLLGVNNDFYALLTSDDDFESVKTVSNPIPRAGSNATSFIPLSATLGAISGAEGFNPNATDYQIDLVKLDTGSSSGSGSTGSGYVPGSTGGSDPYTNVVSSATGSTVFGGLMISILSSFL